MAGPEAGAHLGALNPGATARTLMKEALLETEEGGLPRETGQQEKRIHRTHLEREATKFSFGNFTFFTRGKKKL